MALCVGLTATVAAALSGPAGGAARAHRPPPSAAARDAADPSGTFRLDVRIASRAELPFYGSARSASVSTYLVEIERTATGWMQSHRVCAARIEGDSTWVRTVLPERFVRALGQRRYPVTLAREGETEGDGQRSWRYRADLGHEHVGYRPLDSDTLPRGPGDPAVTDWDADGRPGATVQIIAPPFEGELYVVQRGRALLEGTLDADGVGEGRVHVRDFGQRVIGARPGFLARTPAIEMDPERSRFTLSRLPDGTDCGELAGAARS